MPRPRDIDNPYLGHEEYKKFEQDYPIPPDNKLYVRRRSEKYPGVGQRALPEESDEMKEAYKRAQGRNNRARERYEYIKQEEQQSVTDSREL